MIRKINSKDKPILYSMIEKEFKTTYKDNIYTNWLIYELNNKIIGFVNYDIIYDKSEIEYIYVVKDYQNKGYATELLNQMIVDIKEKNVSNITLEVKSDNEKAIMFYKKNGFKEVAIREKYYGDKDAILMLRSW